MKQAIVIVQDAQDKEVTHAFGPFSSGEEACYWANANCKGFEWHWQELALVNQPDPGDIVHSASFE